MTLLQYFQMNTTYHLPSHRGPHTFNRKEGEWKNKIHKQRGRKMKESTKTQQGNCISFIVSKLSRWFLKMLGHPCAPSSVNMTGVTGGRFPLRYRQRANSRATNPDSAEDNKSKMRECGGRHGRTFRKKTGEEDKWWGRPDSRRWEESEIVENGLLSRLSVHF